jgi:hypothetical protein
VFLLSLILPLVPVHSKHILGANLLVPLFVLSLNHQNPHLGLIALTVPHDDPMVRDHDSMKGALASPIYSTEKSRCMRDWCATPTISPWWFGG